MPARPVTPYSADLGDRDPIEAIRDVGLRMHALTERWTDGQFERSYARGKWTARQILIHLAQCEIMFGTRVRLALVTPDYVAQDMDQDKWIACDRDISGRDALDAFVAVARMNAALFASLSPAARATSLTHPDYGPLTVDWIVHQTAGHQIHHLKQLESLG